MKGVKKYLFLMAVVAALFGFVACSSGDDGASEVAVYARKVYKGNVELYTETLTLYDNDTFETVVTLDGEEYTVATGTYEGDVTKNTSKNNPVTTTIEEYGYFDEDEEDFVLLSIEDYSEYLIRDLLGDKEVDSYTDAKLDALIEDWIETYFTDVEVTIEGDKLTIPGNYFSSEKIYTKQY